jgi:serine/threonine protein kinase
MNERKLLWKNFQVGELPRQSLLVETAKQIGKRIEELTDLHHPHLLKDVAVERKDGHYYLGQETIDGLVTLEAYLKDHTPTPQQLVAWLESALGVLAYVHQAGICLEGLTLENIYISPAGELYLSDYAPSRQLAAFRPIAQEEEYLSPELFAGEERSFASDIWSLGVVIYRAACGTFPFTDQESKLICENILEREPYDPRYYNPQIGPGLAKLMFALLAKDKKNRPTAGSALEEVAELKEAGTYLANPQEEAAFAKQTTKVERAERAWQAKRFLRHNWAWFAGILAVVLIGISLFRSGQTKPVVTENTTPLKVVQLYYKSLDDLDVIVMEQTIDKKVGKQNLDMVSRLHVIEKVNMGMQMQSGQQKGPAPDLVKVQDLKIQGEQSGGTARYTARYKLTLPGEGGFKTTPKQDRLVLRKVEGKWQIMELSSKDL